MCNGGENNEQQCYTNSPQNVSFSDGNLILTARRADGVLDQGRTYTSGRIQSNGKVISPTANLRQALSFRQVRDPGLLLDASEPEQCRLAQPRGN